MVHIFRKVACLFAEDFVNSRLDDWANNILNTMIKKQHYTAPKAELLVVQSEAFICASASGDFTIGGFTPDDSDPLSVDLNSFLGLPGGLTL